ncbi:hypothetical protein GCM10027174_44720 [Salinifilum aidingensis]
MAFTAYATRPPDGFGEYLAGAAVDDASQFDTFHRNELVDARVPDCGQPDRPEFHQEALHEKSPKNSDGQWFYRGRRVVFCPDQHPMKLDRNPHGPGLHFRHHRGEGDGSTCRYDEPAPESDKHKQLKRVTADAYDRAGMTVAMERKSRSLRSQPDITADYDGRRYGLEIQLSSLAAGAASRRTRLLREDGYTPIWSSLRDSERWQKFVPYLHALERRKGLRGDGWQRTLEERTSEYGYHVVVQRIAFRTCDRTQCWYKRLTREKACPGHFQSDFTLSGEDVQHGRQERRVTIPLEEFARMVARGDVRETRIPMPSVRSSGIPIITWSDDADIGDEHFAWFQELYGDLSVDDFRPRKPYCTQRHRPAADPADLDWHGELDARVDLDRDLLRGDQITFHGENDQLRTGMVRSVTRTEFGQRVYDVRYIDTDELGRTVYGQQDVTLDQIATVRV